MSGRIEEDDWDGDVAAWYDTYEGGQHPNLLAFVTVEEWVCSDEDIRRVIGVLANVLAAREEAQR